MCTAPGRALIVRGTGEVATDRRTGRRIMTLTPNAEETRLEAACNQAAIQFHAKRFTELNPVEQLRLRHRIRMVLKAADSQAREPELLAAPEDTEEAEAVVAEGDNPVEAAGAWRAVRSELLSHERRLSSAMRDRPAYGTPGWQEYQDRVMEPLIQERDRLRLKAATAKKRMSSSSW